ncbi:hypothetical protein CROQUDRAFT_673269 [Cronartium quercuum f. sp. fusiforme G11]|uniref:DUF6534 domain-containing protein n=1 Tax=Cronartium quercuum f. sp. fusiforme G11 TaxID=708437 RepID=A0A9P6NBJ7_9BASI|nr:hypothetical protein CROQUDRAFT_673269 [Cronartium quercuum f. sp. fusiforme G11]
MNFTLPGFVIGGYVSGWVGGMVVVEAIRVLYRYPKDHILLKLTVAAIILLSIFHTVSFIGITYYYAVENFGHSQEQDVAIPEFGLHVMLSRVIIAISQLFFTYRLYIFSNKNLPITFLSTLLAFYHLGLSVVVAIKFIETRRYSELSILVVLYLLYSAAIACDMVITFALYLFLKSQKTQFTKTRSIINRIIVLSFQTSLFTTTLAVVSIVILGHVGLGVLYALTLPAVQMYLLSVAVTLNSRQGFAKALATSSDKTLTSSNDRLARNIFAGTQMSGVGVRIDRVVYTDVEASTPIPYPKFSKVRPHITPSTEKITTTVGITQDEIETCYPPFPAANPHPPHWI